MNPNIGLNYSYSQLQKLRMPQPNPWEVCDKLTVQPNLDVTADILKALRYQMMSYNQQKINHRKTFHGDAMLMAKQYLYQMIQIIPTLNVEVQIYHNRSKYNKRKRKKLCYGEHCNLYRLFLEDRKWGSGLNVIANFTTEQICLK